MDKKTIIIAVVAVAVIMLFIVMRDKSSAETVADTMEDKISSDSKKATAAGKSVTMSAEDNSYNQAREKYRTLQGNYPPASWTTEMINVWVSEWDEMSKTLSEYVSLMNKMDKTKRSKYKAAFVRLLRFITKRSTLNYQHEFTKELPKNYQGTTDQLPNKKNIRLLRFAYAIPRPPP